MSYMRGMDWVQLLIFCIGLLLITKPMGIYLLRVLDPDQEGGLGILEKIFGPIERLVYKIARIDPKKAAELEAVRSVAADAGHW